MILAVNSSKKMKPGDDLPDILSGIHVVFHEVSAEKTKRLKRYVVAYNGDVGASVTEKTTHLITDSIDAEVGLNVSWI